MPGLVRIREDRIAILGSHLEAQFRYSAQEELKWDDPSFWNVEASQSDRCQFLAIGNAINFRFWALGNDGGIIPSTGILEGREYRGSLYLWRRLRLALIRGEFSLEARFLVTLTNDIFTEAFSDDDGRCPLAPGIEERIANLRDLGTKLEEKWNGQFANVVHTSLGSLERFAELCRDFRAFDDPVQKLTMVNAIMLTGSRLAQFDADPRPGIDYHLVKQAVRQGLVDPPEVTKSKLIAGELLTAEESLALRRATLDALQQIAKRSRLRTSRLDNLYWLNRRVCDEEKPACKRAGDHRCPFETVCEQRVEFGLPLELTRYY